MLIKKYQIKVPMILNLILMLVYLIAPVNGIESRKLGENGTDEKCTPCDGYSSPPPPANPPPSPPPSPKKPPSQYCPPPPSFIYITGPPGGSLYPVEENFNGVGHRQHRNYAALLVPLFVGLLSMIAFW
ncbi:hypothetical protein Lal_00016215 [Lupinus albus]|uniref:Uncharacterized protein n=1 Tax=Lupinus albus TaxID=3870 RepID=A0A6A5MMI9_LUPAL|nr:hypothetical protein Lalb_Chr05g0219431 [Lupinus albus]KAF1873093.1 hypothetical protein Lal_00016215 [Lupinus albus]